MPTRDKIPAVTTAGYIVLVVLVALVGGLALIVRALRRGDEADARRRAELVARLGARPGRDSLGRDILELDREGRRVRLTRVPGKHVTRTWVETRVGAPGFGYDVQPRRAALVATIGDTLARSGDPAFDETILAMSRERSRFEAVLSPSVRAALLEFARGEASLGWWWRLDEGVLRGQMRGTWGAEGFDERCDTALRLCVSLARQSEASAGEALAG